MTGFLITAGVGLWYVTFLALAGKPHEKRRRVVTPALAFRQAVGRVVVRITAQIQPLIDALMEAQAAMERLGSTMAKALADERKKSQ